MSEDNKNKNKKEAAKVPPASSRKTFSQLSTRPTNPDRFNTSARLGQVSNTRHLAGALTVPIQNIVPNFHQVRQHFDEKALTELAEDISQRGILEPLIVRETDNEPGTYEIIAGERRYRAAQLVGLNELPVIVKQMDEREARFTMLAENLQRADLDPRDEQRFYQELQRSYNLSLSDIAKLVSRSLSYISQIVSGNYPHRAVSSISSTPLDSSLNEELKENSQTTKASKPASLRYNPKVYRRVSEFFDNTLSVVKSRPDAATIFQIEESLGDAEQKLLALKQELEHLKTEYQLEP